MYTDIHTDFIVTPLSTILDDSIIAVNSLSKGIDSFPISQYVMQALFLRLTGASEQKMKCVCWQLATDNYKYRYEYLNKKSYGECSTYNSKNGIYTDIISLIKEKENSFTINKIWDEKSTTDRLKHIKETIVHQKVFDIFSSLKQSQFAIWQPNEFNQFAANVHSIIDGKNISPNDTQIFDKSLSTMYSTTVYNNRNRIAHNTESYQKGLPGFDILSSKDHYKDSFFFRYALIIIMDEIFIRLYKYYQKVSI